MIYKCVICGEEFTAKRNATLCSRKCTREFKRRDEYKRTCREKGIPVNEDILYGREIAVRCIVCGKEFMTNHYNRTLCSSRCTSERRRVLTYIRSCEKVGRPINPERVIYDLNKTKEVECLKPSLENCLNCPYPDCICNLPATVEESQTINDMIDKLTQFRKNARWKD